jgi:coenzyme F420-reducing hydrogenase beta subunit
MSTVGFLLGQAQAISQLNEKDSVIESQMELARSFIGLFCSTQEQKSNATQAINEGIAIGYGSVFIRVHKELQDEQGAN